MVTVRSRLECRHKNTSLGGMMKWPVADYRYKIGNEKAAIRYQENRNLTIL